MMVVSTMSADLSRLTSSLSVSTRASNTPTAIHRRKRRNTLFHLPYSPGKWRHCEPVRAIHSMPSK